MLIERRVDGMIAAAPQLEERPGRGRTAAPVRARGQPAPRAGRRGAGGGVQPPGGRAAWPPGTCSALGHTRIGTITGPFRRQVVRSRLHGYEDALREAGIEPGEDLAVEADWTPGGAAAATRLLLERDPR